jgi:carbamate kinase
MTPMVVVVALGGNALLRRGEPLEAGRQRANTAGAAAVVARLAREHTVVLTHGNGPQVGLLALRDDAAGTSAAWPLDVLDAESEGMIGYVLEQELRNALPDVECATLLTQVVVAADDPAFTNPTKPIGPTYGADEAQRLARERGWAVAPDGPAWRRVVASPRPDSIVELRAIELLVRAGVVVICGGGGGIPVILDETSALRGVEAVIDKDWAAALLATELGADALLLLTDVEGAFVDWATPAARLVTRATPDALGAIAFDEGSMGPKVEAACEFVAATGGVAGIGAIGDATEVLLGHAGTLVTAAASGLELRPPGG